MRISDWSSDVCSSDLGGWLGRQALFHLGYTQELDTSDQPGQLTWLKLQQASLFDRLDCLLPLPVSEASAPLFQLAGLCLDRCPFLLQCACHKIGRASCRERVCAYV